jgi:hypothetical protein
VEGDVWKGRYKRRLSGDSQVIVYVLTVPFFFSMYVQEASRPCPEPGRLPCSYYLDPSVFLLPS